MTQVDLPRGLIDIFEQSSFCPHDAIRGMPETGTAWSSLEIEHHGGSESSYPGTWMFYASHWNGQVTKAERPWGEMSGLYDGAFIKAVVDWFQSMTQAKNDELSEKETARELDATEELEAIRLEVGSVLHMMDQLAMQWGDEGVFRRCRDRLRKLCRDN